MAVVAADVVGAEAGEGAAAGAAANKPATQSPPVQNINVGGPQPVQKQQQPQTPPMGNDYDISVKSPGSVDDTVMIIGVVLIIVNATIGGQFTRFIGVIWNKGSVTNITGDLLGIVGEFVFVFILAALANINKQWRGVSIALLLALGLVLLATNSGAQSLLSKLQGR
jgi:hypothetical protein